MKIYQVHIHRRESKERWGLREDMHMHRGRQGKVGAVLRHIYASWKEGKERRGLLLYTTFNQADNAYAQ